MRDIGNMTTFERLRYAGNIDQLYGVRALTLDEGRGRGMAIWQAETGGGLSLDVLPDNCMDLGALRYRGVNVSYLCKNGYTSPYAYSPFEDSFTSTFTAGMMYTCGLMNVGGGCRDGAKWHPLHGRAHSLGADRRSTRVDEKAGEIVLSGRVREAELFGHSLQIERTITLPIGGSSVKVEDTVTNLSPLPVEIMLLYHFNFGFPFLSEKLRLEFPEGTATRPQTPRAAEGMDSFHTFCPPEDEFAEQVYYHDLPEEDGFARVRALNSELGFGAELRFRKAELPILTHWKSMRANDYALGLEPTNCEVGGRAKERAGRGLVEIPGCGEVKTFVELRLFDL